MTLQRCAAKLPEKGKKRLPQRMESTQLDTELDRIGRTLQQLLDRDIFPWLSAERDPTPNEIERAATVVADRLCGAMSDPIIRNAQEKRPPAPILCTYMGRKSRERLSPFRFILNHSQATAPNVYLMLYPKSHLALEIRERPETLQILWKALTRISAEELIGKGRVYGGGLHKLEPKELGNACIQVAFGDGLFSQDAAFDREKTEPLQLQLELSEKPPD